MKLIPYDKFQINSKLTPIEITQRIRDCTGDDETFNFHQTHEFSGQVNDHDFKIMKNISYRNSFLPVIEGKVEQAGIGSQVTISMHLHLLVIFLIFISLVVIVIVGISRLKFYDAFSWSMLAPFGMIFFVLALTSGGFWFEAFRQKRRLIALLSKP